MGARSAAKTIAQILDAFAESPTWSQADLAARYGINVKALRPHLAALAAEKVLPLARDAEPPHVM